MRVGLLFTALLVGCGADEVCDAASLTEALECASSGDTVRVGDCRIEGSFRVPPGVTVEGNGTSSTLASSSGGVLTLEAGSGTTRVRGLDIESGGGYAVLGDGVARVVIEDVAVDPALGVALALDTVMQATLTRVTLTGPIEPGTTLESNLGPDETATHGLVLRRVDEATLQDVMVTGFGQFGALFLDSGTTWAGGGARDNLVIGVSVVGGQADLDGLQLTGTMEGIGIFPAFAGIFTEGAVVTSRDLEISENERYGLAHFGSTAHHVDGVLQGNGDASVWVAESDSVRLEGTSTMISGSSFAGVVVMGSSDVEIADARIEGTTTRRQSAPFGVSEVGDGVHLLEDNPGLCLRGVTLDGNERAGIGAEIASGMAMPTFENVVVSGTGEQLGAVGGGRMTAPDGRPFLAPDAPAGWDMGIERQGDSASADAAFVMRGGPLTGVFDIAGIIAPTMIPLTAGVAARGVGEIIAPTM